MQEELSVEDEFEEANRRLDKELGEELASRIDRRENGGIPAQKRNAGDKGTAEGGRRFPWMRKASNGAPSAFHDLTNQSISV